MRKEVKDRCTEEVVGEVDGVKVKKVVPPNKGAWITREDRQPMEKRIPKAAFARLHRRHTLETNEENISRQIVKNEDEVLDSIDLSRAKAKMLDQLFPKLAEYYEKADVDQFFNDISNVAAFEELNLLLNSRSEKVKLEAIKDILDRSGFAPVKKSAQVRADVKVDSLKEKELDSLIRGLLEDRDSAKKE